MTASVYPPRMTSDAFVAWAMEQPNGARYELHGGMVFRMASKCVAHARAETAYEPDALVRCGAPWSGDRALVPDPIIVVEARLDPPGIMIDGLFPHADQR